jgi:crotonobetainyl-CoA:carnitine CoA-transferase CaiB-like acyl-CoA transferase
MTNAPEAGKYIAEAIAAKPFSYWTTQLQTMEGPWAAVQSPLEIADDPQMAANGYIRPVIDAGGNERWLVANPVQFDEQPPLLTRAPQFAEHTDEILRELGKTDDEIIQLKIDGACT